MCVGLLLSAAVASGAGAGQLKNALIAECHAWKALYGKNIQKRYHEFMQEVSTFIEELDKKLKKPIRDLDDIRVAMVALKELREREIQIDRSIAPIEVQLLDFFYL